MIDQRYLNSKKKQQRQIGSTRELAELHMGHNRHSPYQGLLHSSFPQMPTRNQVSQFHQHLLSTKASFQHRVSVQNMSLMQDLALQQPENFSPISEKRQSSATFNSSSSSPLYRAAERGRGGEGGFGGCSRPLLQFFAKQKICQAHPTQNSFCRF